MLTAFGSQRKLAHQHLPKVRRPCALKRTSQADNFSDSNGYHAIADPGPPDRAFSCSRKSVLGDDPACETRSSAATTSSVSHLISPRSTVVYQARLITL